jgi:hypothetical protein
MAFPVPQPAAQQLITLCAISHFHLESPLWRGGGLSWGARLTEGRRIAVLAASCILHRLGCLVQRSHLVQGAPRRQCRIASDVRVDHCPFPRSEACRFDSRIVLSVSLLDSHENPTDLPCKTHPFVVATSFYPARRSPH